jgi:hypothetical protein
MCELYLSCPCTNIKAPSTWSNTGKRLVQFPNAFQGHIISMNIPPKKTRGGMLCLLLTSEGDLGVRSLPPLKNS